MDTSLLGSHRSGCHATLPRKKRCVTSRKTSAKETIGDTNMAAVPLFRDTNMAAVTSRENTL